MPEHPQPQQPPSLYRRHRPRTFADVVGQDPVVRTLRNAVEHGKVHHAYLFVGSRGTGKTSMAKILASCLNCERGPTSEPCGECDSCRSIARASSLDVIEMDAASNNSVDDIRELRESVAYAPVSGRRKVYILDEAHMLSTAAWNAFLKTLEEPPAGTVFVLATTDGQKVPATVVDRCHRFDFHRPTVEQIASVLRRTAAAEGIEIPPEAIAAIARKATGSFRDALGTLEQLLTYSGETIALDDVLAVLDVADSRLLAQTVDAVAQADARAALMSLAQYVEQGRDAGSFASDLESRARELLLVQTLGALPPELALTPEADAALIEQAARVDGAVVVRLLEHVGEALEAVRAGADPRTRLELALVKAARPEVDPSARALIARLERLERADAPPGAPASDHARTDVPPPGAPASDHARTDVPPPDAPELAEPGQAAGAPELADAGQAAGASELVEPEQAAGASVAPVAPEAVAGDLDSLRALWPAVVEIVRGANAMLGALIEEARPVAVSGEELTVAFAATAPFLKKKAEVPANRSAVTAALGELTGARWRVSYELSEELSVGEQAQTPARTEQEWVRRFMEEFDAEELPLESVSAHTEEKGS